MDHRVTVMAFAVLICLTACEAAAQDRSPASPFTGRWQEDLHASRRPDGRDVTDAYVAHVMTLELTDTQLLISLDVRVPDPKDNRVIAYTLQTDGRVYEVDLGGSKALAYARLEGDSLTTYLKRLAANGLAIEVLRTMTLAKDGRKMTAVMRSWRDGRPTNTVREIWERQ